MSKRALVARVCELQAALQAAERSRSSPASPASPRPHREAA
jgi:hypothetical protein